MKTAFLVGIGALIFSASSAHASLGDAGLLAPYVRALNGAPGIDVSYSVSEVGGATTSHRLVLLRPDKARIETPTSVTYADGRTITVFYKSSNSFVVRDQNDVAFAALIDNRHAMLWKPALDTKAFDGFASTKNEGTRTRKGETLNLILAVLDSSGRSSIRMHLGQRDNLLRQAELIAESSTAIVSVESLSITSPAPELFTFLAPVDSKRLTEREIRITEYRKLIFVPQSVGEIKAREQVTFQPVLPANQQKLDAHIEMFLDEFSKYPLDFVAVSKLRKVAFVEQLVNDGIHVAANPYAAAEILLLDVSFMSDQWYPRYVLHHEFFHMLEEEWNGSFYFKDPKWAAFNEPGFTYGSGGKSAYGSGRDVTSFKHSRRGFINEYSTYGMEEDRADLWAAMMVPEIWKMVAPFVESDSILLAKTKYLRELARSKCSSMDEAFWKAVGSGS